MRRLTRASLTALVALHVLATYAFAAEIRARISFDASDVRLQETAAGSLVRMNGLLDAAEEDTATLPMAIHTFYVPEGFEVRGVTAVPIARERIERDVRLARWTAPLEGVDEASRFPSSALEPGSDLHPAKQVASLSSGHLAGHRVHSVAFLPLQWSRATGELTLTSSFDVTLELGPARDEGALRMLRHNPAAELAYHEALSALVTNRSDLPAPTRPFASEGGGFAPRELPSVEGSPVDMVIVTTAALESGFAPLLDWKMRKGVRTVLRTTEWIEANYPTGHDQAERIRFFLRDAFQKWGTFLVLFGGDFDEITPRLAFNRFFFELGTFIPTDQYFACLDGDWNGDGDELYGEGVFQLETGDAADIHPDIFVGRATVSNLTEVATFVSKSLTYEKSPPVDYVEDVCHFSEVLFPTNWEFGDPDEDIILDGKTLTEDFDVLIDPTWTRTKNYQSENTQDRNRALTELSAGHHLLTLMNHGDAFKFSVGNGINPLVFIADIDTLTNGDRLSVVVATACNPNQFDLESCGESFMNNPDGGAICVIGPTRVDFPSSAALFLEEMFQIIFEHGVTRFGAATQVNRVRYLGISETDATPNRWTVLSKVLLGDPEIRMWTQRPQPFLVSHPASVELGTGSVTVSVADSTASPVADALVCVSDGAGTYARGQTDALGSVVLPLASSQTGTVSVAVTKPEFLPYEGSFTLDPTASAHLALDSFVLDDDATGASSGNGDGVLDAGETIELAMTALNGGGTSADTALVTASIEPGSSVTFDLAWGGITDPGVVYVGPDQVHPASVPFTLDFSNPSIEYIGTPSITLGANATSGDVGIYLWQDTEGWHLWWTGGGDDSTVVNGTVTTDGRIRATAALDLEPSIDSFSLSAGEDSLTFTATTHATDLFDQLDFWLADSTALSVATASAPLGDVAPSASSPGTIVFDASSAARDGQIGTVDLTFTSVTGGPWTAEVPVVFAAPSLEAYVFTVDDTANPPLSGNGNSVVEVGETVRLTPTVLNRGSGAAVNVVGDATATTGITFLDATDGYGEIARFAQSSGVDGYVFTVDDSTGTKIVLTLTDDLGRTWDKSVDFTVPAAPTGAGFTSTSSEIVIGWDPSPEADLAGYNVYRSTTPGSGHTLRNFELLRSGARYVDEGLPVGAAFYYQITAVDSSGNESVPGDEIFAWTTRAQVAGWPQNAGSNVWSSIAIADADGDGQNELFVGSLDFGMYSWDAGGSVREGFPVLANGQVWSTPGLADIDEDGDLEIFWGANDSRFYAVHHDTVPVFGSEHHMLDLGGTGSLMRSAAAIADVDFDSDLEFFFGTDKGALYGFNHDGTGVPDSTGLIVTVPGGAGAKIWGPIAIADIGNDGNRKLAFASWNDSLYVVSPDGTLVPGFPRGAGGDLQAGPAIADLDGDGTMEILVASNDTNLYAFDHDGADYLPGGVLASMPDQLRCVPAIANLDLDPELEVVVSCWDGFLYAFNHDGTGLLQPDGRFAEVDSTGRIFASPIVADVDGDADFEVFVGHLNGSFYGFHHDGSLMIGMPMPTSAPIYSTAAAGDLDGDGDVDVAFASYDQTVNVIDFDGASSPSAYEWPTYGGNNFRTSVYGEGGPYQTGVDPVTSVAFALAQNRPNPFPSGTSIDYVVPRNARVKLRIFDVSGRLVRTLVNGPLPPGAHRATWDGRDGSGNPVASGVYFYRLENGSESLTRKGILLR